MAENSERLENGFHRYLGDGVYASFDGFQIWLAEGDHHNRVVALEPGVFQNLVRYEADLQRAVAEAQAKGGGA